MKRVLCLLTAIMLILTLFAGCGKSNESAGQDMTAAETTKAEASTVQEAPQEVTVQVLHYMSEQGKRDGLKAWTDAITAGNPEIKFDVQGIDFNQYQTTLKTKIAAGDPPDVIFGRPKMYADMVKAGHIMDLTGQPFVGNVAESATASMKLDEKVYGVAFDLQTMGVFYNKDLFQQAGVEVPKTYSELIKLCDTLQSKNIIPFSHGFKDAWTAQVDFQSDFYSSLGKIPTFFKDVRDRTKKFADFPEFKASLERYAKRLSYSSGDDFGTDYSKSLQLFATGKTAMVIEGNWALGDIRKNNPEGNFGFFANPFSDNADENVLDIAVDDAFMVSAQTKVKDAVFKLFDYATSAQGTEAWVANTKAISVIKGAGSEGLDPMVSDILAYVSAGKTFNFESIEILSGQHDSIFRKFQEEFAADSKRDADKYIQKLDKEFDDIK